MIKIRRILGFAGSCKEQFCGRDGPGQQRLRRRRWDIIYLMKLGLSRRLVAELLGTAFLVAAVIGSGVMATRLSAGNVAIALLANSIATGAALAALILAFGSISGAHFNPAVSVCDAFLGNLSKREAAAYIAAQSFGGLLGVAFAHLMFSEPLYSLSQRPRHGAGQLLSEFVAAFGLMAVIWGCSNSRAKMVPFAVAAYITAAYWFTASTSFANPGGNARARIFQHLRGNPAARRPGVYGSAVWRGPNRHRAISLAPSKSRWPTQRGPCTSFD